MTLYQTNFLKLLFRNSLARILFIILFTTSTVNAQGSYVPSGKDIVLLHRPPVLNESILPFSRISFKVTTLNTNNFEAPLKIVMVKDNKVSELIVPKGALNLDDIPEYTFTTLAPRKYLSYYLVYTDKNARTTTSKTYLLQRNCIPGMQTKDIPKRTKELPEGVELAKVTSILEREINAYDTALKLIDVILKEVEK